MTHASDPATYTFVPPTPRRDPSVDREIDTGVSRLAQLLNLAPAETVQFVRYIDSLKKS